MQHFSDAQIDIIVRHYIIAAIWADSPDESSDYEATPEGRAHVEKGVRAFLLAYHADCIDAVTRPGYGDRCAQDFGGARAHEWPFASFGHDLYLTSQGHGTGFWDRAELKAGGLGARLTDACDMVTSRGRDWNMCVDFDEEARTVIFF
ncbi:hypothetical protein BcepSauron_051 [Burkholderia phage BcepSauron]|uniref:Uncharacterized protein n=2 Tax=Sarumanvirus TaxID=2843450 RepID=A0A482MK70_9CAUD|nr:hypothetical protein H1O16_gp050 [Burkholderia phage BcepSaruman]YP_009904429.1 hypothetical protein H1O17_gp051 [Burkholderia phage BcepSauron]QBQ74431.1 hypothetical protein BcepSauron_051 [Burkholderia phage BcepSauron]QBX06463.1 hypothetical protein BcepSaruman_050 [Burkholderia phage BcepSaruman]